MTGMSKLNNYDLTVIGKNRAKKLAKIWQHQYEYSKKKTEEEKEMTSSVTLKCEVSHL